MRRAFLAFCRNTTTTASDLQYPFPSSSNDLHFPSTLRTPRQANCKDVHGWRQILQPPTIAASQISSFMALYACSRACMLEEHAESTAQLGPKIIQINKLNVFIHF